MIRIRQMKLPVSHSEEDLRRKISRLLRCGGTPFSFEIIRQSLDARHKDDKKFVYTVDVTIEGEQKILKKVNDNNIMLTSGEEYHFPSHGEEPLRERPVIAGAGPAGLICAWYLAREGYHPVLLERGDPADIRLQKVRAFWEGGVLDPESNVQFGEGGAGTFSDGKLNTLVKDTFGRNREVLRRLHEAGAPGEILYLQKPHLGTDMLVDIVKTLRLQIEEMGGTVRFRSRLTDLVIEDGSLCGVRINEEEFLPASVCVLAIGHSARDTFRMLQKRGIPMEPKAFAVGLRIEHPQELIDQALYGSKDREILGPAAYKVTHSCRNGRGVYSFCMCPGGYVVNSSSEEGRLAVNGMSYQARDSRNANSALIVTVTPEDFPEPGPLGGVVFQQQLEEAAYRCADGAVPVQRYEDFLNDRPSAGPGRILPCIKGAWAFTNVRKILPGFVTEALLEGIPAFSAQIPGYDDPDALLSGIESRTSSPVRIVRGKDLLSAVDGVYPCGEGAGYAGGITSAAMDGLKTAEAIAMRFDINHFLW